MKLTELVTPLVGLLLAASVHANDHHQTRTYFGWPTSAVVAGDQHPRTARIFGFRCSKTPQALYHTYMRKAQILQAKYQNRVNRYHGCAYGSCAHYPTYSGGPGNSGCCPSRPKCGQRYDPVPPGMNREDAVRYLEGFLYHPPYHIVRSPRDFIMFDDL